MSLSSGVEVSRGCRGVEVSSVEGVSTAVERCRGVEAVYYDASYIDGCQGDADGHTLMYT